MKKPHPSTRPLTALLGGIMCIPLVTQVFLGDGHYQADLFSIYRSIDDEGKYVQEVPDLEAEAIEHRALFRAHRRAYSRAIEDCRNRLRDGEDVSCPDFNDFVRDLMEPEQTHKAAPAEPTEDDDSAEEAGSATSPAARPAPTARMQELTTQQRATLRSYTRAGFCSRAAGVVLYDLCLDILGLDAGDASPTGIANEKINLRLHSAPQTPKNTLRLRLQMLEEALDSTNRRNSVLPQRYNGSLNQDN